MNKLRIGFIGVASVAALLAASPAANATTTLNTRSLLTTTSVGGTGDSVTGICSGTPAGGNFGMTDYVVTATASASSTVGDVGLATGVTCRVWNDVTNGY